MSALLLLLGGDSGGPTAKFTFNTEVADANGYVSEVGAKALSVWAGGATSSRGVLQSVSTALMRARFNMGVPVRHWRAEFTMAGATGCEFYVDIRDNGTNRVSVAADDTHFYIFDSYNALTVTQIGISLVHDVTYTIDITDVGGIVTAVFSGDIWLVTLGPVAVAGGVGATQGGVTTTGQVISIDNIEATAA
jgi:hypothetical protein